MKEIINALMGLGNEGVEIFYMDGTSVKGTRYALDPVKKALILSLHDSHSFHIVNTDEIIKVIISPFKKEPIVLKRTYVSNEKH